MPREQLAAIVCAAIAANLAGDYHRSAALLALIP